jgi:23S rRNA (cytosine1962-C5)-methyltransferase
MTIEYPAEYWKDYELVDSGRGEKLERFGKYTLIRPEPKALWDKTEMIKKSQLSLFENNKM